MNVYSILNYCNQNFQNMPRSYKNGFFASLLACVCIPIILKTSEAIANFLEKDVSITSQMEPVIIANPDELNSEILSKLTEHSYVKYFKGNNRFKIMIDASFMRTSQLNKVLQKIYNLYESRVSINELRFQNLSDISHVGKILRKFKKLKIISFENSKIEESILKQLMNRVKNLRIVKFLSSNQLDSTRFLDLEEKNVIYYSSEKSNIENFVNQFLSDLKEINLDSMKEVERFLSGLEKKSYFPMFLDDNLKLSFSSIKNISDIFVSSFLNFLLKVDSHPKSLDFSNTNLRGDFLKSVSNLKIRYLIFQNMSSFENKNLAELYRFPYLEFLNLKNTYLGSLPDKQLRRSSIVSTNSAFTVCESHQSTLELNSLNVILPDILLNFNNLKEIIVGGYKIMFKNNNFQIDVKIRELNEEGIEKNFDILLNFLLQCRNINKLSFKSCTLTQIHLSKIAFFLSDKNINILNLSNTKVKNAFLESFHKKPNHLAESILKHVQFIYLHGTEVNLSTLFSTLGKGEQRIFRELNNHSVTIKKNEETIFITAK
ncbi:MAG: hypothetical protein A3F40_00700 [Chlamydiae bacterium RIFCSPHIGHO2_12_FULL_27_8]|nr:MAG: hypothetical protein A3F40_00700 [Chlamydiae bacterium RIFCSPHIGHO2_12_FULL_27_8]